MVSKVLPPAATPKWLELIIANYLRDFELELLKPIKIYSLFHCCDFSLVNVCFEPFRECFTDLEASIKAITDFFCLFFAED